MTTGITAEQVETVLNRCRPRFKTARVKQIRKSVFVICHNDEFDGVMMTLIRRGIDFDHDSISRNRHLNLWQMRVVKVGV